jgi:intron-binding protein aquarius
LVSLGFKYDNVVMEEAAQILEVETFIPLLLQETEDGRSRLKRVIMIGDHNQLPPVVKNMAFQQYGNMEQSLFTRFVKLGVPTIDLDAQVYILLSPSLFFFIIYYINQFFGLINNIRGVLGLP